MGRKRATACNGARSRRSSTFPANAYQTVLQGQRATLQVEYNEIDPLTAQWVNYYSYVQTNELNKRILVEALKQGPGRARG